MKGVISAIAANRKGFFDLVERAEQLGSCDIDEVRLQALIDSDYSGREILTDAEVQQIIMQVSQPRAAATAAIEDRPLRPT
jgi:hypothetical protein